MDDRTLAPSPSRLKRAWRAGHRPRSRWLAVALRLGVVALAASAWDLRPDAALVRGWSQALASSGAPRISILVDTLAAAGAVAAAVAVLAVLVHVVVALATGSLGPVDARLRERMRVTTIRSYALPLTVLALVAAAVFAVDVLPVLAGASRAADAPGSALGPLLLSWVVRVSSSAAVILGGAGLVELAIDRRRRDRSLFQSFAEAQDDLRERGRK